MPKLSWDEMMDRHPAGHLVVGELEGPATISKRLLEKLLKRLALSGDYSLCATKEAHGPVVQVVFARKDDADKFAEGVNAARSARMYPGWASQRAFDLDEKVRRAVAEALRGS